MGSCARDAEKSRSRPVARCRRRSRRIAIRDRVSKKVFAEDVCVACRLVEKCKESYEGKIAAAVEALFTVPTHAECLSLGSRRRADHVRSVCL